MPEARHGDAQVPTRIFALDALFEHSANGLFGSGPDGFRHHNLGLKLIERVPEFFERVPFHKPAIRAGTGVCRSGNETLFGEFPFEAVEHSRLGDDDETIGGMILAVMNHLFGGTNFVGEQAHGGCALGMCDDRRAWKLAADFFDTLLGELHMHVTGTLPEFHGTSGLLHDPCTEVLIGHE